MTKAINSLFIIRVLYLVFSGQLITYNIGGGCSNWSTTKVIKSFFIVCAFYLACGRGDQLVTYNIEGECSSLSMTKVINL